MNHNVAAGLMRLAWVTTEDDARQVLVDLVDRGATPGDLDRIYQLWADMRARDVVTIEVPATAPFVPSPCLCSHAQGSHTRGASYCDHRACGCTRFRAQTAPVR